MLLLFINVHLVVIHLTPPFIFITIIISSLFLLFLCQLEEHTVCEVELNNKKNVYSQIREIYRPCILTICVFSVIIPSASSVLEFKAGITLYIFLVLRWQLSPTQMKSTCNAKDSTYITLCFLIRIKYFGVHTQILCTLFPKTCLAC